MRVDTKPFDDISEIPRTVSRHLRNRRLKVENKALLEQLQRQNEVLQRHEQDAEQRYAPENVHFGNAFALADRPWRFRGMHTVEQVVVGALLRVELPEQAVGQRELLFLRRNLRLQQCDFRLEGSLLGKRRRCCRQGRRRLHIGTGGGVKSGNTWEEGKRAGTQPWNNPGKGGMGLLSAMDLVIAMPVR